MKNSFPMEFPNRAAVFNGKSSTQANWDLHLRVNAYFFSSIHGR